jgi:CRISPR-associated protein Cas1
LDIPPALIIVDGSGEITLDAMEWLAVQNVPVVRLRWNGSFSSIVTGGGQAANPDLVSWQADTRDNEQARAEFALDIVRRKTEATIETMKSHVPRSKVWDIAMHGIERRVSVMEGLKPNSVVDVLGWEAGVAADYFRAWSGIKLNWRITKRNPIPREWLKYATRAAISERRSNRNATHPINAMLNYAYTVLIGRMQIDLMGQGYDPTIGIMHDEKRRRGTYPAFALDWMEPMRPVVDREILHLIHSEALSGADFSIQDDGACRLNPELARRVTQLSLRSIAANEHQCFA